MKVNASRSFSLILQNKGGLFQKVTITESHFASLYSQIQEHGLKFRNKTYTLKSETISYGKEYIRILFLHEV